MAGSPWGQIQHSVILKRGFRCVSTAGHGGIMVTMHAAEKHLSETARKFGERYGNYLCYEEDCLMSIPIFENVDIRSKFSNTKDEQIIKSLSYYYPEYLLERGIPFDGDEEVKEKYLAKKKKEEEERMEKMIEADTISSVDIVLETRFPDCLLVTTKDNNIHLIQKGEFSLENPPKLLSECIVLM